MTSSPGIRRSGFADPVHDAQRVFRAVLDAMSSPARIVTIPTDLDSGGSLYPATCAALLTLADLDTRLWLQPGRESMADYFAFHCGCSLAASPDDADFAVLHDPRRLTELPAFRLGSDDRPELGCSVIVEVTEIDDRRGLHCTGPGIESSHRLDVGDVGGALATAIRANHDHFPRGIDFLFTCGQRLAALPRSTRIE